MKNGYVIGGVLINDTRFITAGTNVTEKTFVIWNIPFCFVAALSPTGAVYP